MGSTGAPTTPNGTFNMSLFDDGRPVQFAHADFGDGIHNPVSTVPVNRVQLMALLESEVMLPPWGINPFVQPSAASGTMVNDVANAQGPLVDGSVGVRQLPSVEPESLQVIHQQRMADFRRQQQLERQHPEQPRSLQAPQPPPMNSGPEDEPKRKQSFRAHSKFENPSKIVTFLIGEHRAKFCIHKDVVCHYSPVLNEQLNTHVEEGKDEECLLEEVSEETFSILLHWLYNGRIQTLQLDPEFEKDGGYDSIDNKAMAGEENTRLVQAWVLGDKFDIPRFQNDIVDAIFNISRAAAQDHFDTKDLGYVWENTAADSLLRALFIRLVMCGDVMDSERFDDTPDDFPKEFLLQFAKFGKTEDFGQDWDMSTVDYHLDVSGETFGIGKKRKREEYEDDEDDEE